MRAAVVLLSCNRDCLYEFAMPTGKCMSKSSNINGQAKFEPLAPEILYPSSQTANSASVILVLPQLYRSQVSAGQGKSWLLESRLSQEPAMSRLKVGSMLIYQWASTATWKQLLLTLTQD